MMQESEGYECKDSREKRKMSIGNSKLEVF